MGPENPTSVNGRSGSSTRGRYDGILELDILFRAQEICRPGGEDSPLFRSRRSEKRARSILKRRPAGIHSHQPPPVTKVNDMAPSDSRSSEDSHCTRCMRETCKGSESREYIALLSKPVRLLQKLQKAEHLVDQGEHTRILRSMRIQPLFASACNSCSMGLPRGSYFRLRLRNIADMVSEGTANV